MIRLLISTIALAFAVSCSGNASVQDAAVHLDGLSCVASGTCPSGTECGGTCCEHGEACIDGTCMCGTHGSCTDGNTCESPVVKPDRCGGFCCGVTSVCPGVATQ